MIITVLLMICIPVTVFAVKNGIFPSASSGGYFSATVNRMDISLDKTDFELKKTNDGSETFIVTAELSIKKCEPDFFAHVKSVSLNGLTSNYILFTADSENGGDILPEDLYIRDTSPLKWKIEISFNAAAELKLTPELIIEYSSGLTKDTADEYQLSIPLTFTVK